MLGNAVTFGGLDRFSRGGPQLKGTRIGRTSTNQIAGSFWEVNKPVKLRVWAEVQEHTDPKGRWAQVANQLWPGRFPREVGPARLAKSVS
jgi:hypothetical protein